MVVSSYILLDTYSAFSYLIMYHECQYVLIMFSCTDPSQIPYFGCLCEFLCKSSLFHHCYMTTVYMYKDISMYAIAPGHCFYILMLYIPSQRQYHSYKKLPAV